MILFKTKLLNGTYKMMSKLIQYHMLHCFRYNGRNRYTSLIIGIRHISMLVLTDRYYVGPRELMRHESMPHKRSKAILIWIARSKHPYCKCSDSIPSGPVDLFNFTRSKPLSTSDGVVSILHHGHLDFPSTASGNSSQRPFCLSPDPCHPRC